MPQQKTRSPRAKSGASRVKVNKASPANAAGAKATRTRRRSRDRPEVSLSYVDRLAKHNHPGLRTTAEAKEEIEKIITTLVERYMAVAESLLEVSEAKTFLSRHIDATLKQLGRAPLPVSRVEREAFIALAPFERVARKSRAKNHFSKKFMHPLRAAVERDAEEIVEAAVRIMRNNGRKTLKDVDVQLAYELVFNKASA